MLGNLGFIRMGRKSRLKQQRRFEEQSGIKKEIAEVLKAEKACLLNRRNFIVLGLAAAIAGTGILAYTHIGRESKLNYARALKEQGKREQWARGLIDGVEIPPYATISYADEKKYNELREQHPGKICKHEDVFAVSIPQDAEKVAHGTGTDIYVSPGCFLELYKQTPVVWKDLEIIIKNTVINHELLHACHFNHGFAEYPLDKFYNSNGEFNKAIFMAVTELLGHKSEFNGLMKQTGKASSQLFSDYLRTLPALSYPYYNALCNPAFSRDLDSNFIARLKADLNPRKF